jgi:hypothetical protein
MKLAIFVQQQKIVCYSGDAAGLWTHQRIKGETALDFKPEKAASVLQQVLKDQSERINQEHALRDIEVHLLYGQADVAAMSEAAKALADLRCATWQILRMEPLLERAAVASGSTPTIALEDNDAWLKKVLLPLLSSTFTYANAAFQAEEARARQAHDDTLESLRVEVSGKRQEVAQLHAQIRALQLPDMAHLLSFLPAIYRNFWGTVRPDELALLAGTLTAPVIPSPYSEPSPDTVLALQRRLSQLPELDRERVLGFCRGLPHRLDVRPEMRGVLGRI